jgi:hypothetical protein
MSGVEARAIIENELRREIFGPLGSEEPAGKPIDCTNGSITFSTAEESRGQFHDAHTLQEILTVGTPLSRYGIGVLYSGAKTSGSAVEPRAEDNGILDGVPGISHSQDDPAGAPTSIRGSLHQDIADSDDFDLTDANKFKPSAMGISFQCRAAAGSTLNLSVTGAHYERISVKIPGLSKSVDWWRRRPFTLTGSVDGSVLLDEVNQLKIVETTPHGDPPGIAPTTSIYSRRVPGNDDPQLRLVTVAVLNQVIGSGPRSAFFQMGISVEAADGLPIRPYPAADLPDSDDEEKSIELLFRNKRTYAIGHGCAAEWERSDGASVSLVRAVALPAHEVVSLTPNVYLTAQDGSYLLDSQGARQAVTVSMKDLADETTEGQTQVETVLRLYSEWIEARKAEIEDLPERFQTAAGRHMDLATKR